MKQASARAWWDQAGCFRDLIGLGPIEAGVVEKLYGRGFSFPRLLYYTSPTKLAAVLPAATPVGTGILTVNYRGTNSAPAPIQVLASAVGFNHFNQIPIPLGEFNANVDVGVATDNLTGAVLTFTNSGAPGQTIVLWATGLGADPADSDTAFASPPHAVNTPLQIYFGGVQATILYQDSAGYPGVNQINLTIPASVLTGCYVPLVAVTGKIISNVVMFPIHSGGGTCVEPGQGTQLTGDQILRDVLKAGAVNLIQTNVTNASGTVTVTNSAAAGFAKDSGLLAAATGRSGIISPGGCAVGPLSQEARSPSWVLTPVRLLSQGLRDLR